MTPMHTPDGVSLYVHVPFCASKCSYCDFGSTALEPGTASTEATLDAYLSAVLRELERWQDAGLLSCVPTVNIGGGTPSVLRHRLPRLVSEIKALPGLSGDAEISCEANPDSLDDALVEGLLSAGATRVSLGVQSLDDEVLEWLGRRHDASRALSAAGLLRDAGIRFSMDLMCGIPVQTRGSWAWTVEDALATGVGHLSVYPLSVEDATPLFKRVERGDSPDTDPDVAAEDMTHAAAVLSAAGFERYEVASYARPGQECRHNTRYWTGGAYLGVGPGAASMLPAEWAPAEWELRADAGRVRFTQHADFEGLLAGGEPRCPDEIETLTRSEALREDAMLGMRLSSGISESLAEEADVVDPLIALEAEGLVVHEEGRWRTTDRGWLLGNEVFGRVWSSDT